MGPHTGLEKWLDRLWRLAPKALAEPALPLLEKLLGKRADFIYAGDSIAARLSYLPAWRQRIDLAIAPSSYARETLIRNDFPPERIVVSPYGVNPPDPALKKRPSGQLRFAFIGRITYLKGVHLLIEAAARLNRPDRAEFIIYGRPDVKSDRYYRAVQAKARALPNLHWAGLVDNAGVSQLYQTIDVLVVPSLWPENSPMTVLEALAHGVPVIASHVAGITDLVQHEVNGLLFANQQVDDLTAHLRRCLASPEVVTQLAQNCRLVKSMADDAAELCQRYAQLLANRRQAQ
jgi:glycosyltransferase involved in cell wall biosynthesis